MRDRLLEYTSKQAGNVLPRWPSDALQQVPDRRLAVIGSLSTGKPNRARLPGQMEPAGQADRQID
jgi:hypothetical protein